MAQKTSANQQINTSSQSSSSLDLILNFLRFIIECIATAFEVVSRKNFGERYFTVFRFLLGLVIILLFAGTSFIPAITSDVRIRISSLYSLEAGERITNSIFENPLTTQEKEEIQKSSKPFYTRTSPNFGMIALLIYAILYMFFGLQELSKQFQRNKEDSPWHSYYTGESRITLLKTISDKLKLQSFLGNHLIANNIIKLYLATLGIVSGFFIPQFGLFLVIGAVAIFVRGQVLYSRIKKQILDIKDSQIESQFMGEAIKGADPKQTAGFSTMSFRPQTTINAISTDEALQNVFKNNPELEKMAKTNNKKQETEQDKQVDINT